MEMIDQFLPYLSAAGTAIALVWLVFRELAPKTPWEWDDQILSFMEGVGKEFGVAPRDLIRVGDIKREEDNKDDDWVV